MSYGTELVERRADTREDDLLVTPRSDGKEHDPREPVTKAAK